MIDRVPGLWIEVGVAQLCIPALTTIQEPQTAPQ